MKNPVEKLNDIIAPWEEYSFSSSDKTFKQRIREGLKRFYIWSQRQFAIRYLPAVQEIKHEPASYRILEVGSGPVGMARYTKRKIIGADIDTKGPNFENMQKVTAKAWDLPFADKEFDCVVSIDMLEHIPREYRQKTISEMLRVARNKVIFTFPSGSRAEQWEEKARIIYHREINKWPEDREGKERFIQRSAYLTEHFEHKLPTIDEIFEYLQECKDVAGIRVDNNEGCYFWYWGMVGHMKYNYARWVLTTIFYIVFFPMLAYSTMGGVYRKVFIIKKEI